MDNVTDWKVYQATRWVRPEEAPASRETKRAGDIARTASKIENLLAEYGLESRRSKSAKSDSEYIRFRVPGGGWSEVRVSDHDLPDIYVHDDDSIEAYLDVSPAEYAKAKRFIEEKASEGGASKGASGTMEGLSDLDTAAMLDRIEDMPASADDKIQLRWAALQAKGLQGKDREARNRRAKLARTYPTVSEYLAAESGLDIETVNMALGQPAPESTATKLEKSVARRRLGIA